jgi:hypothetical protein
MDANGGFLLDAVRARFSAIKALDLTSVTASFAATASEVDMAGTTVGVISPSLFCTCSVLTDDTVCCKGGNSDPIAEPLIST